MNPTYITALMIALIFAKYAFVQNLQTNSKSSANSIGMIMTELPPGKFKMGSGVFAVDVTLTQPFAIGKHEVTQKQWKQVMGTEP